MKKKFLSREFIWGIITLVLSLPFYLVNAQRSTSPSDTVNPPGGGGKISNPLSSGSFTDLVESVAATVAKLGATVAAIFIIYSGFKFVAARGNEEELKKAKQNFFWVVIGTAILLGAWVIAKAIKETVSQL